VIGALSGTLAELSLVGDHVVEALVDVHGVGYRVLLGSRDAARLPEVGGAVGLSVHTHVREGDITLYGFSGRDARQAFELLITSHGVGPALGLAILSVHTPAELARAVAEGDLDALCLVPGVGRKTAQRLAIDLASRLDTLASGGLDLATTAGEGRERAEVRDALAALGYGTEEVRSTLERLPLVGTVEELLREALRELAPQR
jgi:Holliday junction DNA helicase RuvA